MRVRWFCRGFSKRLAGSFGCGGKGDSGLRRLLGLLSWLRFRQSFLCRCPGRFGRRWMAWEHPVVIEGIGTRHVGSARL